MCKRKREEKKSRRIAAFFLGWFIGILFCCGTLVGVGFFAYYNVSASWLNKKIKTDINLGNDKLNNKTLSVLVNDVLTITKNLDTYTINDFEDDFGFNIKDDVLGIDISDLKNVAMLDLKGAIFTKFNNISANELQGIGGIDLDKFSSILDKTNTYYFNSQNKKLYKNFDGQNYFNIVDFEYKVDAQKTKIIIKQYETPIVINENFDVQNQVNIQLWFLPISKAFGDFSTNIGGQITLEMLEKDFGVELPSFLDKVNKTQTTINGLEKAINELYVGDFLNYIVDDSDPFNILVKDDKNNIVTGIMYDFAIEKIKNISSFTNKIKNITAYDIKDVVDLSSLDKILNKTITYNVNDGYLYKDVSYLTEVDFEYVIVGQKVVVNDMSFLIEEGKVDIKLKHLPLMCAFSEFTSNLGDKLTLMELKLDYGVNFPEYIYKNNEGKTINEVESIIKNILIADILGYTVDDSDSSNIIVKDNQGEIVKGIMLELALEKVEDLSNFTNKIENITALDLEGIVDFSSMDNILNKSNLYYVDGNALYKDALFMKSVDFEYEIDGQNVVIDGELFLIEDKKVNICLKYLPLACAISDFTSSLGDRLTLLELKQDFGVNLPEFIYKNNELKTINEFEEIINNVLIADVLGYTIDGDNVKNGDNLVVGIMSIIAKKKVEELKDIQSIVEEQTIATLLGYSINDGVVADQEGNVVTGILAKVAPYSIKNIDKVVDQLTLVDIFGSDELNKGAFKLFDQSTVSDIKIANISNELESAIKTSSINKLIEIGFINLSPEDKAKLSVRVDHDKDSSTEKVALGDLSINQLLDFCFDLIPQI